MKLLNQIHASLSSFIYGDRLAVVPPSINPNWPQRQFLRRLLEQLEVDCLIDVGANIGQYGLELRLIGYDGLILSFEPSPGCFELLQQKAADDPGWHVFNCALGSQPGQATMNEMSVSQYNSFHQPSTEETDFHAANNVIQNSIEVAVETLNDQLPVLAGKFGFERPFLKMDTQGFDMEVFRGSSDVRDQIVGMQSEVAFKRIYDGAPSWHESLAEYEAAGFDLVGIYKVNPHRLPLIECDAYMMRSGAI